MFTSKLSKISFFTILIQMIFGGYGVWAQITLKYPYERSVFQRKNDNTGSIQVTGNLDSYADQVEARLVPRVNGQGVTTNWKVIDTQIDAHSFTGTVEGTGGWYKLEVRTVVNGEVKFTNAIERVGIGEVFVIAGQSNAQGNGNTPNAKPALDDRVVAFNTGYFNHNNLTVSQLPEFFEYEPFVQLSKDINIGPTGYTPWAYGELGDYLAAKLNVPILFFNSAASGTSTENWVKSINGLDNYHIFTGIKFEAFFPYNALKKTLQSFINILGIRAILWHQGEFDLYNTEAGYFNNLKTIIQETRNNTGENIPWVISRVSRISGVNYPHVIRGQNNVIANITNTWPGPSTDNIQPNRPDEYHFENNAAEAGLSQLAFAWNNSLTTSFFQNVTPIVPKGIVEIKHDCIDQKNVTLKFDSPYTYFLWPNGQKTSTLTASSGDYYAYLKDGYGNVLLTNKITIANVYPKITPVITTSPSLRVCEGNAVTFEAQSPKYKVYWSVDLESPKFAINLPGNYSAKYKTNQNCLSPSSAVFTPIFVKPPVKPQILATDNKFYTCEGTTLEFYIENPQNNLIEWSTGATGIGIQTNQNLPKPIWVKTYSNFDCPSPQSDTVTYRILKNPKTPSIEKNGPYELKAVANEVVTRYDWFLDNNLLNSQTTPTITLKKDGIYSVKTVNSFQKPTGGALQCISGQSTLLSIDLNEKLYGIQIYPNPSYDGKFYLASNLDIKKINFKVYNGNGQMVHQGAIGNLATPYEVDLKYLKPIGKHFIEIQYEGLTRIFPIIFQ